MEGILILIYIILIIFSPIIFVISIVKNWQGIVKKIKIMAMMDKPLHTPINLLELVCLVIAPITGFIRMNDADFYAFNSTYIFSLIFFVYVSFIIYWISRFFKQYLPTISNWVIFLGLFQGLLLNVVLLLHFGFTWTFGGLFLPVFAFELATPLVAIPFFACELYTMHLYIKLAEKNQTPFRYALKILQKISCWNFQNKLFISCFGMLLFFYGEMGWLRYFNQKTDAVILVFTESNGFSFSKNQYLEVENIRKKYNKETTDCGNSIICNSLQYEVLDQIEMENKIKKMRMGVCGNDLRDSIFDLPFSDSCGTK